MECHRAAAAAAAAAALVSGSGDLHRTRSGGRHFRHVSSVRGVGVGVGVGVQTEMGMLVAGAP